MSRTRTGTTCSYRSPDVLLHSLTAMIRAAVRCGRVLGPEVRWASRGRPDSRRRKGRGALVGVPRPAPADVDSVDGPIFTAPRPR